MKRCRQPKSIFNATFLQMWVRLQCFETFRFLLSHLEDTEGYTMGGSAALLPFKYHPALIFGFMAGYCVFKAPCAASRIGQKERRGIGRGMRWRRRALAVASLWKAEGNARGQNGAQSYEPSIAVGDASHFPWILNGVCCGRQTVPVTVICMFNPPPHHPSFSSSSHSSPIWTVVLPLHALQILVCICVGENHPWPGLAATCTAIKGGGVGGEKTHPPLYPFNVYEPQPTSCKELLMSSVHETISV